MSNTVTVRLNGGLGNQMFQYAAARAIALRNAASVELDMSWFGADPSRAYALGPFSIAAKPKIHFLDRVTKPRFLAKWLGKRTTRLPVFEEAHFHYDEEILRIESPVLLKGFFQSERYFASVSQIIAEDFKIQTPPSAKALNILRQIEKTDAICVHFRRGDYIQKPKINASHGTASMEYYTSALEWIQLGLAHPHLFVFSDDPDWVRENFKPAIPMTLVDIHSASEAHEDLRLMAACQHFVIANSTFSWWAAWLGSDKAKRVAAPKRWFQSNKHDTRDLLPDSWKKF